MGIVDLVVGSNIKPQPGRVIMADIRTQRGTTIILRTI
jgi:hypothetical protein